MSKNIWLGFVFLLAIAILTFSTLIVGDIKIFRNRYEVKIHFDNLGGTKKGDEVRVDGIAMGKVSNFQLAPKGVIVQAELERDIAIYSDYYIFAEQYSILGGNVLSIFRGTKTNEPIDLKKEILIGKIKPSSLDEIASFISQNRESFSEFVNSMREIVKDVKGGSGTLGKLLKDPELFDEIKDVFTKIKKGEGTLGKLITDETLYKDLTELISQAKKGKGFVSKILYDEKFVEDITNTINAVNKLVKKLDSGEGTLGKIISDDSLYKDIRTLLTQIKEGKGFLSKALYDEKFADEISSTFNALQKLAKKLESDKGTLSQLMNDESLYKNIKDLVNDVKQGKGILSKLIHDEKLACQVSETIEKVDKVVKKIESGEGTLGKLTKDDELYKSAKQTLEGTNALFGKAAQTKVYFGADYKTFTDNYLGLGRTYLKIVPSDDKYFLAGVSVLDIDPKSKITYENGLEGRSQYFIKPDAQLAYKIPWFLDKRLTGRFGILEGKVGGGLEFDLENLLVDYPLQLTIEGRDAYNSVKDEDIDENIGGIMVRGFLKTQFAKEGFFKNIKLFAGATRAKEGPELFGGLGFEYEEEDIKTLVGLIGLTK